MWIFNKTINRLVDKEVAKRIDDKRKEISFEISKVQKELEEKSFQEFKVANDQLKIKLAEVDLLASTYDIQIDALKKLEVRAEEEQKQIWDRLGILRDSFSADQIWSKLWGLAYSKAVDVCWPILEKEIPRLVELAEQRSYLKATQEIEKDFAMRFAGLVERAHGEDIPRLKIVSMRDDIHNKMLAANRSKNTDLENKYQAQIDLIDLLIGV